MSCPQKSVKPMGSVPVAARIKRLTLERGHLQKAVNWVLNADIRGFFDNMSHEWTIKFIGHRVTDCRILGPIQKWLKAGVSFRRGGSAASRCRNPKVGRLQRHGPLGFMAASKNALLEEARKSAADALIVGRPQSESIGRLRDLSYSVIRDAPCLVLSV